MVCFRIHLEHLHEHRFQLEFSLLRYILKQNHHFSSLKVFLFIREIVKIPKSDAKWSGVCLNRNISLDWALTLAPLSIKSRIVAISPESRAKTILKCLFLIWKETELPLRTALKRGASFLSAKLQSAPWSIKYLTISSRNSKKKKIKSNVFDSFSTSKWKIWNYRIHR